MSPGSAQRPVLMRRVRLFWYPVLLVPILALGYLGFTTDLWLLAVLATFAVFMWLFSLGFALWQIVRPPARPRR